MDEPANVYEHMPEIQRILHEFYTVEDVGLYFRSPQERFDGLTAEQMMNAGRGKEVLDALRALEDCVYL